MKKLTTKEMVFEHAERVKNLKTTQEISSFIAEIGCKTQQRWGRAVAAIVEIGGPDYYALRGETRANSAESLRASVTHEVELYVDAKARCQRFGICASDGNVIWHGIFFEDDQSFSYGDRNEQSACECAAARKAIWLAGKIKESVGAKSIRLTLKVDAQWLTTGGGKATILQSDARRFNIELNMEWIIGKSNPADAWTTASGFKKWDSENLSKFAMPVDPAAEKIAEAQADAGEISIPASTLEILNPPTAEEIAAEAAAVENSARLLSEQNARDATAKVEMDGAELVRITDCISRGDRLGTSGKITTFGQFDKAIAAVDRLRLRLNLAALTPEEISALKAIQNFTNENTVPFKS